MPAKVGTNAAALAPAGAAGRITCLPQAGGAFPEWLEGRSLPGIEVPPNTVPQLKVA